jgi:membrane-associated phospholipid phosphatase
LQGTNVILSNLITEYQPNLTKSKGNAYPNWVKKLLCWSLPALFYAIPAFSQPILHKNREIAIAGTSTAWTALNYTFQFTSPKIPKGNTWNLGRIDALAISSLNKTAKNWSDITIVGTAVLSGLSVLNKDRDVLLKNGVVMAQSVWMTANLAHSAKLIFKRNRPYTQAPGFTFTKRDEVYSFFSGHSAVAASFFTSALLMLPKEGPSFKGQKILIGAAGLTAATTMLLRVRAGKHYPTDVITGGLVGMGIAWINYRIHAK